MKAFKENIVKAVVAKAETEKIVSLREVAAEQGAKHLTAGECRDIIAAVGKQLPGYRPAEIVKSEDSKESLFCSLCFIEDGISFED